MTKFINTDNDTYTNINLIEKVEFKSDRNGDYIRLYIKDQPTKQISKDSEIYEYFKNLCID